MHRWRILENREDKEESPMNLTIHRGTHEIGGTCVEIESGASRIVVDIGMPLVDDGGDKFNDKKYKGLSAPPSW